MLSSYTGAAPTKPSASLRKAAVFESNANAFTSTRRVAAAGEASSSPGGATTPLRPTQVLTPTRLAQRLADAEGDEGGEDGEL